LAVAQGTPIGTTQSFDESAIPSDAFFGMTISEAVKKYLRIAKRKKPLVEIVKALDAGGIPHQSKNFYTSVSTSIRRDTDIVQVGRGEYGLAEWYAGGGRKQKSLKRGAMLSAVPDEDEGAGSKETLSSSNGQALL